MRKIFFRADGSNAMGVGHIYRCCALAQILAAEFHCCFLLSKSVEKEITAIIEGHFADFLTLSSDNEAQEFANLLTPEDIAVLDGYHFDTTYQKLIKASGASLVCVDDIAAYEFVADVVINHAGGIDPEIYSVAPHTKLYLGPQYAIIRQPFVDMAKEHIAPVPNRILIAMGGADPDNATTAILKDLLQSSLDENRDIHVVAGAKFHFLPSLLAIAEIEKGIHIHQNIDGAAMAQLMASAETCIAAPSTVAFEYLTCSTGAFVMYRIADNQKRMELYFMERNFATKYTDYIENKNDQISIDKELLKAIFDGESHERIRIIFRSLYPPKIHLEPITKENLKIIFDWVNEPITRKNSFDSSPIDLEEHTEWFFNKLIDPKCHLYIGFIDDRPIGQIRFDENSKGNFIVSFGLALTERGKGLGLAIIKSGIEKIKSQHIPIHQIVGFVKKNNKASIHIFRKLGFSEEDAEEYPDALKYTLLFP